MQKIAKCTNCLRQCSCAHFGSLHKAIERNEKVVEEGLNSGND